MNRKPTYEEVCAMHPLEVYNLVLEGKWLNAFPRGFWQNPEATNNPQIIIRYLFEEKFKFSDDDILKLSANFFTKNKLGGMLAICFNYSPFEAINAAYPGRFKPYQMYLAPQGYWNNRENGIDAIKWLIDEKLKLSDDEIIDSISKDFFKKHNLNGMLLHCFNGSPFGAINAAYPNRFKPSRFKYTYRDKYDSHEEYVKNVKWLIEEKLQLSDNELLDTASVEMFEENNLSKTLKYFNRSPFKAINAAYPGKYKFFQFKHIATAPVGFWKDDSNCIEVIRWLIEEKLKLSDNELMASLSKEFFREHSLDSMLKNRFNNSPFRAIDIAYPGKYKKVSGNKYILNTDL